jgi:hypothetical protein
MLAALDAGLLKLESPWVQWRLGYPGPASVRTGV